MDGVGANVGRDVGRCYTHTLLPPPFYSCNPSHLNIALPHEKRQLWRSARLGNMTIVAMGWVCGLGSPLWVRAVQYGMHVDTFFFGVYFLLGVLLRRSVARCIFLRGALKRRRIFVGWGPRAPVSWIVMEPNRGIGLI